MAMPNAVRRYTVQEVLRFPDDGKRHELLYGELFVSPAPATRHQMVVQRLYLQFVDHLRPLGLHEMVFCLSADISWDDETLVQPDLFIVPREEISSSWTSCRTLLLAVEVLSPSSRRADRKIKRQRYQEAGVNTYWIVDHEAGVVEVWHPDDERPEIVTQVLNWRLRPDLPELQIDLSKLFDGLPD